MRSWDWQSRMDGSSFSPALSRELEACPLAGRGAARAEDAQGTPPQSHISPSTLVYEEKGSAEIRSQHGPTVISGQGSNRGEYSI